MGKNKVRNPFTAPPQQRININIDELENIVCEECNGDEFTVSWKLKKIPIIYSQTGKESIAQIAYFKCAGCGLVTRVIKQK